MRNLPLREFQQRGAAALRSGLREPLLLTGREARYFLVPVQGEDIDLQYRELVKALGLASLRAWQIRSRKLGIDRMGSEEISAEIRAVRARRGSRRRAIAGRRRRA